MSIMLNSISLLNITMLIKKLKYIFSQGKGLHWSSGGCHVVFYDSKIMAVSLG